MQEDFIQFLPYLRTEYRVSTGTGKEQAAKEIAGRITPEKNLDSLFILLKCFNKYKEIRRDPDHLLWVKKTLKDIAAWKLITMINKEFYHGYKIENKKEGIHIDLGFRDEFYVDGFFVELSISGLYKKKPELGDPYTVVDPEAYIPKVSVHTNKMVPILESGPSKPGFIHCVLYSLYTHYLYGEPAEYNESMIRSERVLNFIRTRLEADNTANTPIFIFLGSQYKFTIDVKKALVSDLKRLLPALNVFGFTVAEDSFLIHSPAYVIDNISKFLHDLNEA